jgi:hypothetical protein
VSMNKMEPEDHSGTIRKNRNWCSALIGIPIGLSPPLNLLHYWYWWPTRELVPFTMTTLMPDPGFQKAEGSAGRRTMRPIPGPQPQPKPGGLKQQLTLHLSSSNRAWHYHSISQTSYMSSSGQNWSRTMQGKEFWKTKEKEFWGMQLQLT